MSCLNQITWQIREPTPERKNIRWTMLVSRNGRAPDVPPGSWRAVVDASSPSSGGVGLDREDIGRKR